MLSSAFNCVLFRDELKSISGPFLSAESCGAANIGVTEKIFMTSRFKTSISQLYKHQARKDKWPKNEYCWNTGCMIPDSLLTWKLRVTYCNKQLSINHRRVKIPRTWQRQRWDSRGCVMCQPISIMSATDQSDPSNVTNWPMRIKKSQVCKTNTR